MKNRIRIMLGAVLLGICVAAGMFFQKTDAAGVIFEEKTGMQYREYIKKNTIEDSMLFIGTYLIHSQVLTDELYEMALESAVSSNQKKIYYKSELADGRWTDITNASGLGDLSVEGSLVEEAQLADLWITSYTGSDGITLDVDGNAVSIFDVVPYSNLYYLPELEPLRLQYDNVYAQNGEGVAAYYHDCLEAFFELDLTNSVTNQCDNQMEGLQKCYDELQKDGETEMAEIVSRLMGKIDAKRRAEIFRQLVEADNNMLLVLQKLCSGNEYDKFDYEFYESELNVDVDDEEEWEYTREQFVEDYEVTEAIAASILNCQESYMEYTGIMLEEGTTVLSKAEYTKSMEAVRVAVVGYNSRLENILLELEALYHVQNDTVADKEKELKLLDSELLSDAETAYVNLLKAGTSLEYQAAVRKKESNAVKENLLNKQQAELNAAKEEFYYLIQAKAKRMDTEEAVAYIYERIETAEGYYGKIRSTDFKEKAEASADHLILELTNYAKALMGDSKALMSEVQRLEEERAALLLEKAQALDNNDLSAVKKLEAEIAVLDEAILAKEQELSKVIGDTASSAGDKAQAINNAGKETLLGSIQRIKNNALEEIADGNADGDKVANAMEALAALGAEEALKDILEELEDSDAKNSTLYAAEKAIRESRESSLYGALEETDTSTDENEEQEETLGEEDEAGTGENETGAEAETGSSSKPDSELVESAAKLTREQLTELVEVSFGSAFEDLNDSEKATVTAVLNRLTAAGSSAAEELAEGYLRQCISQANPHVFMKFKGADEKYLPLEVIGECCGYRYVYSDSGKEITLTQKTKVYRFTLYDNKVYFRDGTWEKLVNTVKKQGIPYLSGVDVKKYFGCQSEYMENAGYGICLTKTMTDQMEAILDSIKEG